MDFFSRSLNKADVGDMDKPLELGDIMPQNRRHYDKMRPPKFQGKNNLDTIIHVQKYVQYLVHSEQPKAFFWTLSKISVASLSRHVFRDCWHTTTTWLCCSNSHKASSTSLYKADFSWNKRYDPETKSLIMILWIWKTKIWPW